MCYFDTYWSNKKLQWKIYVEMIEYYLFLISRQAYQEGTKVKKNCLQQIQRVMRQRAVNVDLHPEIEVACVRDLGEFCQDKTQKGQEILCLQVSS